MRWEQCGMVDALVLRAFEPLLYGADDEGCGQMDCLIASKL